MAAICVSRAQPPATAAMATQRLREVLHSPELPAGHHQRVREFGIDINASTVLVADGTAAHGGGGGTGTAISVAHIPFTCTSTAANSHGSVHGGNVAWLADTATSMHLTALITSRRHVSIGLNVTYLKPVPVGVRCIVESRVIRVGRSVAFLEADILLPGPSSGLVTCASVHHSKMLLSDPPGRTRTPAERTSDDGNRQQQHSSKL